MESLERIEAWLGQPLLEPYRSFLVRNAESFLTDNDEILLYGVNAIAERNDTYQSRVYCPGHLMIADDGGGLAFVLSLMDGSIHSVGMGAMTPDCFSLVAANFAAWQASGFPNVE
ncbi:MAG: SMI1/KNR4 family protein [Fimbriiglobus sp.]